MENDFKRRQYYLTFEKLNKFQEEEDKNIIEEEEPKKESKFKRLVKAIYEMLKVNEIEIKSFSSEIRIDIQDLASQIIIETYITTSGKPVIELYDFTESHLNLTEKSLIGEVEFFLLSQHQAYLDRISEDQGIRFNFDELFRDL